MTDLDMDAYLLALDQARQSVMVALFPNNPETLAVSGGEPVQDIHLTLAFLGRRASISEETLIQTVQAWASRTPRLSGEVSGIGTFTAGPDPVSYYSADIPRLPEAREQLVQMLTAAGIPPSKEHGFTPHITVDYRRRKLQAPANNKLVFGSVVVAYGDDRTSIPFTGRVE